ncbi:hypothetical protein NHX12_020522 [Muraenolepis orangiensis]|uniref:Microsomal glutathione S-transferase 1 n=1 Tax=Muraenolepis orangiensis TaxID=630683 RepID=A0A9Q0ES13_9TELE|nr:hypothetical protein NHX12_020522 [Muraenolepis orangiensis]
METKTAEMASSLIEDEVFLAFSTYATLMVLKTLLMGPLTAYFRFSRRAFANAEDVWGKSEEEKKKKLRTHPDVERIRRCHQNDLENVVPFVLVGLLYTLTGPDPATARLYFRAFAASRLCHTLAYVLPLPQPSRALSWATGMGVTLCMAYRLLSHKMLL